MRRAIIVFLALLALLEADLAAAQGEWPGIGLRQIASGLDQPIHISHAGDGSGRLFVVEQPGRVRIIRDEALLPEPFLDITDRVGCCGERGLLSLAFPAGYAEKGYFYAHYTDLNGNTRVSRFRLDAEGAVPDRADPASEEVILTQTQPFANHNGGQMAFGPDGYLYLALGDGGSAGDPFGNAQSLDTLLGKILRIDPESVSIGYAVPADNPFIGSPGELQEIWAYGLRNPWRFSFDRESGDLWIGDVGQNSWEEIDRQPAGSAGGENYGWDILEGNACFEPAEGCTPPPAYVPPVHVYPRADEACAVIGGFVYRGQAMPALAGFYLFADYCSGVISGLRPVGEVYEAGVLLVTGFRPTAFGEDEAGELYVTDYTNGAVLRIEAPGPAGDEAAAAVPAVSSLLLGL